MNFFYLRSELNKKYILTEDLNANMLFDRFVNNKDYSFLTGPFETRFGARQTDIEISLIYFPERDTFWIKIIYEYSNYYALHSQIYDEEKLKNGNRSNGL